MTERIRRSGVLGLILVLSLGVSGCFDLDVSNPNEPDRDRALSTPGDVEALIASQFRVWWNIQQGNTAPALDAMAELESGTQANFGFQDQGEMPPIPIVNQVGYQWGYWMQDPFLLQNRALAAIRDGIQAIEARNLDISQPNRLAALAKFLQGVMHGNIALLYDRGFIIDETATDPASAEVRPYGEVMTAARGYLAEARALAAQGSFTIPAGLLGTSAVSSATLIQLTHAYEARFMAQVARSPQERAQVNWSEVLSHTERGIQQDFGVDLDGPGGVWNSPLKQRSSLNSNTALAFIGPADQSGAYQAWEDTPAGQKDVFLVDTDDRRITDGTPTGPGLFVVYRPFLTGAPERGRFFLSNYARQWWKDIGDTGFGFAPDITAREMDLLAAEAHLRLGNPQAALAAINRDRVALGELPPAGVEGVAGDRCVPRAAGLLAKASDRPIGSCGDLLQTLIYEKRMAMAFVSQGSVYYDARGFGTLRTGRAIQAPIPAEDLQLIGIPTYTFGGVGGEGAAP